MRKAQSHKVGRQEGGEEKEAENLLRPAPKQTTDGEGGGEKK